MRNRIVWAILTCTLAACLSVTAEEPYITAPESCRHRQSFDATAERVWDAIWDAWSDLSLPDPDRPGDVLDQEGGRIHVKLFPNAFGESWGFEAACCDSLSVDMFLAERDGRTDLEVRLTVSNPLSDCCDLDLPGGNMEQRLFEAVAGNVR